MPDARAVLRVVDELLWSLRRAGFVIATSQAIDVARAARAVGFESKDVLREVLAAVIGPAPDTRARFDRVFDAFFAAGPRRDLWEHLAELGVRPEELGVLRELLEAIASASDRSLSQLAGGGSELDRLLSMAGSSPAMPALDNPLTAGFATHRLLDHVGVWRAREQLSALRALLADALGAERADLIASALDDALKNADEVVRTFAKERIAERRATTRGDDVLSLPLVSLDPAEVDDVRRAVQRFVERLRGGERVRRRRALRGRVDAHRTIRKAMRTGGVPFVLARRARKRDKPRLMILCDVSESVRSVARFLLELAYSAQGLFAGTRTFVFVSELGETTRLFTENTIESALTAAYSGRVVPVTHNSNYGRALRTFGDKHLRDVDRRTTVVILGDGRTNYFEHGAEILESIRSRARALVWLCPEPRSAWATGDSAMLRYAPKCTQVLEVQSARDLQAAARLLLTLR